MQSECRSLRELFLYGKELLSSAGIEDAGSDAHILLEYAAGTDRSGYYLHMQEPVDSQTAARYEQLLQRRKKREPVQYITGETCFYGNTFSVTPDVLIPRQDTEVLVAEAEKRLRPGMQVLDLCTGSGCVLLSVLSRVDVNGVGSDLSAAALAVAEQNRKRLGLRARWIESDLFAQIEDSFDMITANPPYIATDVMRGLDPEVIGYEPETALDGGDDGLDILRRIIQEVPEHLNENGWLLLEIGYDQGEAVSSLLQEQGFREIQIIRDLEHRERVAAGRRKQGADPV